MTDAQGDEHGVFSIFFDHREQQAEAYCVCGVYETGATLDAAETALLERHLAQYEEQRRG